jgi:hypothetical protein
MHKQTQNPYRQSNADSIYSEKGNNRVHGISVFLGKVPERLICRKKGDFQF